MHPIIGQVWHQFPTCVVEGGDRYDRYLCSALFMTMHAPKDCANALALLDAVQAGQSKETAFGLNDTEVNFTDQGAQVTILIEDEATADGLFSLTEFRQAVVAWNEFLSASCSHQYSVEVDLS
ncbi:hypothetical protein D3C81_1130710 [compost metagenome]